MAPTMATSTYTTSHRPPFPLQLSPRALRSPMAFGQSEILSPRALAKQEKDLCLPAQESIYIHRPDQDFWTVRCAEILDGLMQAAGSYTPAQRAAHIRLLTEIIVPAMGPHPSAAPTKPLLTADGSPFEPSWNITDSGSSSIRFSFEPMGRHGGSESDPFAQKIVPAILPALRMVAHGADTRWFEQFMSALFLTESETKAALAKLPKGTRAPTSFLAFDLDGDKAVFKAYFFPILKHIATGESPENITFNAIRSLSPGGADLARSANATEAYFRNAPFSIPVEMIALDCIDPAAGARAKLYARTRSNAFNVVRDVMTLGGQIHDETTLEGLDILRSIWHLLHNEPEPYGDDFDKQPKLLQTLHKGICYGFELKPGAEWPEVKAYVPLWQYAGSDAVISSNLAKAFRSRGWPVAETYEDAMPCCFPRSNLGKTTGTHSYISFAFSKQKGAYLTIYYSIRPQDSLMAF
ncbi:Aromatic prenyltransferase [Colletotrichum higginsianum IMI 349063]|uniref:Aromatic prenyltransferase n=4 Tax=Colletotrichum destructivum species complex TaxID=2707350 RepID=A0A1B7Y9J7_COLHI|nr:Aromatic prenyltransferase [Colletotrichum higginsianum IMI 349063]OBR08726.1 Aromatic prenyltransferase [Colletotrichum higginsianum IMI 349063]TIC95528.1 Indole prenyltransferase tdiB [Colletotrichum higginsianum]